MRFPKNLIQWITILIQWISFSAIAAAPAAQSDRKLLALDLETYEPTTLGYTHDGDDVRFMDFKLSVKYPLVPNILFCRPGLPLKQYKAYMAFTGRWGQYISTRPSSPVVSKRFNPKFILRRYMKEQPDCNYIPQDDYIDIAYAHESNGQSINSQLLYDAAVREANDHGENPAFVNDNVSRGWDYLEATWKKVLATGDKREMTTAYVQLKYFLPRGFLQGRPEQYEPWEMNPEGKPRKAVNGVGAIFKHEFGEVGFRWLLKNPKVAVIYETGYSPAFRHHTVKLEGGIKFIELPVTVWMQRGYGSDLAQYYKKVTSWGIQVEIGSF